MSLPFELPSYHKKNMKYQWKKSGIIFNGMFEEIYDIYINCSECDYCKKPFKSSRHRHLDHDHDITDEYNIRNILCNNCNNNKKKQKWESNTGEQYINKRNHTKGKYKWISYRIRITRYGKLVFNKERSTLEKAIVIRDKFISDNPEYFL